MVSNKTVGDIQGPWRGPPTRLKRALDDKNVAEFAFAREDLRRITNEIAALAARSMPNSEDEDILDLKPGGSHNLDGSKEPDSAKLARSAQLMLSATNAIGLYCRSNWPNFVLQNLQNDAVDNILRCRSKFVFTVKNPNPTLESYV